MKHKTFILSLLFLCVFLIGCGPQSNNRKSIDDLVDHFKQAGLHVGQKSDKLAVFIGASDGTGLDIDGSQVEFYKFDIDVPVQKAALDKYHKDGWFEIMGTKFYVIVNGSFMLLIDNEHSKWNEIEKAFQSF